MEGARLEWLDFSRPGRAVLAWGSITWVLVVDIYNIKIYKLMIRPFNPNIGRIMFIFVLVYENN